MSVFASGTGGDLLSTNTPAALFEISRILVANENTRNAANSGIAAVNNITASLSLDGGIASIAATIPITASLVSGVPTLTAKNYLGGSFANFVPGTGGTLQSTNSVAAFLETAQTLAALEKTVTPLESQPNNVQITYDLEAGVATVSANLPFSTSQSAGAITINAIDYL